MTKEWNAKAYHVISAPQFAWGMKVLERVAPRGDEAALDAGCGSGRLTAELLARLPNGTVTAADRSQNMVDEARKTLAPFGDRVRFHCGDLLELPHEDAFDLVFSTATFHWILDHQRLFRVLFRALKPGGRLVAQCGGAGNLDRLHAIAEEQMAKADYASFFTSWTGVWEFASAETTAERLTAAGFELVSTDLELAPTPFADRASFRLFLENVVLRPHLAVIADPDKRASFLDAVVDGGPYELDYVRLNIGAQKAS
ncbi:MAG: class I SAM-dependent methyltransferase [Polyangiaceae bacterium]|nr:class I SAM-dependent methyltransferase [Polyangiaceae bacterium]